MERIQVTVDDMIEGDSDDAFDIMLRFDKFHEWWPSSIPVKCVDYKDSHIGNKALISPYPLINIGWKLHSYDPGREIIIHYYQGMHEGMGVWSFSETDTNQARISFEIDILPKNAIYNWAYKIFNVKQTHIQQVKMVIAALVQQMKKIESSNAA